MNTYLYHRSLVVALLCGSLVARMVLAGGIRYVDENGAVPRHNGSAKGHLVASPLEVIDPGVLGDVTRIYGAPDARVGTGEKLVYSNTLGRSLFGPPQSAPGILIADDISLAAVSNCSLDHYVIKVSGDRDQDGSGVGPYSVDAALYDGCPGAGNATPIPGTECHFDFGDNGTHEATCSVPTDSHVPIPNNLYLGVSFSRPYCGVAVGAPATVGFSADSFDFPGFACRADLGGFVPAIPYDDYGVHASFYAEIYTRAECPDAFPNYKGSMHAGLYYTPGGGIRFADDISLSVPQCYLTAYEVAVKGHGVTTVDLRIALNNADPVWGGVIPGTRKIIYSDSDVAVTIGHWDFDPPIHLSTPDLWVGYKTSSAVTGPVITDRPADLGWNHDLIAVYSGAEWVLGPLPDGRYAATNVIIHCADSPPTGACCDMLFTSDHGCIGGSNDGDPCTWSSDCPGGTCIGDAVCRDGLPEMNCPSAALSHRHWEEGDVCEGVCDGGDNDGQLCTRQIDCPGSTCLGGLDDGNPCLSDIDCSDPGFCRRAECDGPFIRACGLSACCTFDDYCYDVTEKECFAFPPIEEPAKRMFQRGQYCGLSGQRCPFGACLAGEGDCFVAQDTPGCNDPFCCTNVCFEDVYCCFVEWDQLCVAYAYELCDPALDCNENGVPDGVDIAQGTSDDCQPDGIPDECQVPPIDPTGSDCNGNTVPDECEEDCNENGIPDECDIDGGTSPDSNGNGVPDDCEAEPPTVEAEGGRYLSVIAQPPDSILPVALAVLSPDYPCLAKYVDANGMCVDAPVLQTPGEWAVVHVHGADIVPETTYQIHAEVDGFVLTTPVAVTTSRWGDTVGGFVDDQWTPPNGVVDFNDITAAVDAFKHAPTAPPWQWCDVAPETPDGTVDFTDIAYVVGAFQSAPYPFGEPDPCP